MKLAVTMVAATVAAACGARAASVPGSALDRAITIVEIRHDGTPRAVAPDAINDLDRDSRLAIQVDGDALRQLVVDGGAVEVSPADRAELDRLTALTRQQVELAKELLHLGAEINLANAAQFDATLTGYGVKELAFLTDFEDYAQAAKLDVDTEPRPPSTWLRQQRKALLVRLTTDRGVSLRLQAALVRDDGTVAVHLDNYDDIEPSRCVPTNRFAPEGSMRKIQQQLEVARALSASIGDLGKLGDQLVTMVRERAAALAGELRDVVLADVATLRTLSKRVLRDKLAGLPEAKALALRIEELNAVVGELGVACQPVIEALAQHKLPTLSEALTCGAAVNDKREPLVTTATATVTAIKALASAAPGAAADVKAEILAVLPELETIRKLQQAVEASQARWKVVAAFLSTSRDIAPATFTTDGLRDRALDQVSDSRIDLICTPRKDGDVLQVRAALVAGGREVEVGALELFRVVREGPHVQVSAGVLFLEKVDDDRWGSFKASPGVVAALHYRSGRDPGEAHGAGWWNALDPGVGLHFSYPDFGVQGDDSSDDPAFELGVGGTVVLFGDLLQVGSGYDIQANVPYWYIGFGLDSLADLGVTYGLPGR